MITIYLAPISANERRRLRRWAAKAETPAHPQLWTAELVKVYFYKEPLYGKDAIELSPAGVAALSEGEVAGLAMHEVQYRLGRLIPYRLVCEHMLECSHRVRPSAPADPSRNLTWAYRYARQLQDRNPPLDGYTLTARDDRPKQSA